MPLRPTSIADVDMRRRWNLADDDPGPTSLPKMLFPEDEARRLGEARSHMLEFRPERDGYGRPETFAEIGGQDGTDELAGGARDDTIVGTVSDTRRSNKHVSPVPDPHSSFIIPEGKYNPNANLGSLVTGSPSQSTAPFRYRSVAEQLGFDKAPNLAQVYTDGRRDYPSAQAAERDMPQFRNPVSAKGEYEARRGKAFLDSIGAGALGLGPMSYVMGGSPEAVQASTQFDEALGGLAAGKAMRPAGAVRFTAPRAEAPEREVKKWPGNDGFLYRIKGELPPNYPFDRYGDEGKLGERKGGLFTAPFGTPYEQRAVGYRPRDEDYHAYETIVPNTVEGGPIVPWFGQPGGGWQFKHPENMTTLLAQKKIRRKP